MAASPVFRDVGNCSAPRVSCSALWVLDARLTTQTRGAGRCIVRAFDGEGPTYITATGFVVDAVRGIILTNRHVVTPGAVTPAPPPRLRGVQAECVAGPISAEAMFHNKEEVRVTPIYRDPIHDFGFFHFNVGCSLMCMCGGVHVCACACACVCVLLFTSLCIRVFVRFHVRGGCLLVLGPMCAPSRVPATWHLR